AVELLTKLAAGPHGPTARRALAAYAIDKGKSEVARATLSDAAEGTFTAADRVAIGALAHADVAAIATALDAVLEDPELGVLASAVRAAIAPVEIGSGDRSRARPDTPNGRAPV